MYAAVILYLPFACRLCENVDDAKDFLDGAAHLWNDHKQPSHRVSTVSTVPANSYPFSPQPIALVLQQLLLFYGPPKVSNPVVEMAKDRTVHQLLCDLILRVRKGEATSVAMKCALIDAFIRLGEVAPTPPQQAVAVKKPRYSIYENLPARFPEVQIVGHVRPRPGEHTCPTLVAARASLDVM
jgi:hypothetical protein